MQVTSLESFIEEAAIMQDEVNSVLTDGVGFHGGVSSFNSRQSSNKQFADRV